jgi:hypothetical protein
LAKAVNPHDTTETRQGAKEAFLEQHNKSYMTFSTFFQPIFERLNACIPQALIFYRDAYWRTRKQSPNSKTLAG